MIGKLQRVALRDVSRSFITISKRLKKSSENRLNEKGLKGNGHVELENA